MEKEKTISQKLHKCGNFLFRVGRWFEEYEEWRKQYQAAKDEGGNPPPPPPPPPGENDGDGD